VGPHMGERELDPPRGGARPRRRTVRKRIRLRPARRTAGDRLFPERRGACERPSDTANNSRVGRATRLGTALRHRTPAAHPVTIWTRGPAGRTRRGLASSTRNRPTYRAVHICTANPSWWPSSAATRSGSDSRCPGGTTAARRAGAAGFGGVGSPRVGELLAHSGRPYRIVGSKESWESAGGRGPVPVAHMPSKVSRR
jgi:hypothetical protein